MIPSPDSRGKMHGMRWMTRALAFTAVTVVSTAGNAETFDFDGTFVPVDTGSYLELELEVPEGTSEVRASYSYVTNGDTGGLISNVVDLGISDPDGFRGWTGSSEREVTVALTDELTSEGYIPGPIPAGIWVLELGAGFVATDTTISWEATVETVEGTGDAFEPPEWEPVVLGGPGWYAGDLHCHSEHSDGRYTVEDVVAFARERGLQFLALTDHNTFTGHFELPEIQADDDAMLLVRGMEWTSYIGHANVYGISRYLDYHATTEGHENGSVVETVHEAGGFFSVNHPELPGTEVEGIRVSLGWEVEDTDWSSVDFIEVVNGAATLPGGISNPINEMAIAHWDRFLLEGHRITAIGGSDDHLAGHGSTETDIFYAPIGTPTTVVQAEELSEAGILAGLRAGHAFLKAGGPDGPDLFLTATCGDAVAMMGDEIAGASCSVEAQAVGAGGMELVVLEDGAITEYVPIGDGEEDFTYTFELVPADLSIVRVELRRSNLLQAMTNPVYLRFAEDESVDSSNGCECSVATCRDSTASRLAQALVP